MDSRLLRPDPAIISAIFIESQPDSVEILAHCFTNCTFKAEFKDRPTVIVRLDTSSGSLDAVSALQEAAAFQIPTYVPETLASGKAVTADQRNVDYTVTRFISGTVPLESVWPSLDLANKTLLVDAVVKAVKKLSEFKVSEKRAQSVFSKICTVDAVGDIRIGGPRIGFAEDTRGLITLFVAQHQQASRATSSIEEASDGNGILIKSALPELGEIHLSAHDLKTLDESVVFQHNDLEPRNLLVKREESKDGLQYKLAAIIDWEMAGFFPSAFETAVKDISLGSCNQYLEWYFVFKERTRAMISGGETSEKLIKAVHLIADSRSHQQKRNVSAEIRRRWISREGLQLSDKALEGWVLKTAGDGTQREMRPFAKADNDELALQVLKDFGRI